MFEPCKIIFKMASPVAAIDFLHFDAILSAAKAKEFLGDNYYNGISGVKELHEPEIPLKKEYGVFCASIGYGDSFESIGSWTKRWDDKNDDLVKFGDKVRNRVDLCTGHYKNYHMPLVIKSYKEVVFYANGDVAEIERLLKKHIFFIGKKSAQGYGEIKEIIVEKTDKDYSLFKNNRPTRPIPIRSYKEDLKGIPISKHSIIPPYWRTDKLEFCYMPE